MSNEIKTWHERCDWLSNRPAPALMVEAMKAEIAELRARTHADAQLIAEQNRLAKERQEWALQTNQVIRELRAALALAQAPSAPVARALQKRDPVEFSLSLIAEWNEGPQDVDTWGNHAASQLEVLGQLVHESRIAALSVKAGPTITAEESETLRILLGTLEKHEGTIPRCAADAKVIRKLMALAAAPTPPTTGEA